jgi:hypothetical protein
MGQFRIPESGRQQLPTDVIQRLLASSATKEKFFLAFSENAAETIRTRWSNDGVTWQDGAFPSSVTTAAPPARVTLPFGGIGASADRDGIFYNVIFDQPYAIADVWGLGPAIWDTSPTKLPAPQPTSAPSAIDIGALQRLIAVQGAGSTMNLFLYDHAERDIVAQIPIAGPLNTNVYGRPAITMRKDGKLLIAWGRGSGEVVAAVGERRETGYFRFDVPANVTLSSSAALSSVAQSSPVVSADSQFFYLAVVQEERGAPLHGWRTLVYRSSDGATWQEFAQLTGDATNQSTIQVAAKSNGTLLVAGVTRRPTPTGFARLCRRTTPTSTCTWTTVAGTSIFGQVPRYRDFALVRAAQD